MYNVDCILRILPMTSSNINCFTFLKRGMNRMGYATKHGTDSLLLILLILMQSSYDAATGCSMSTGLPAFIAMTA